MSTAILLSYMKTNVYFCFCFILLIYPFSLSVIHNFTNIFDLVQNNIRLFGLNKHIYFLDLKSYSF